MAEATRDTTDEKQDSDEFRERPDLWNQAVGNRGMTADERIDRCTTMPWLAAAVANLEDVLKTAEKHDLAEATEIERTLERIADLSCEIHPVGAYGTRESLLELWHEYWDEGGDWDK